MTLKQMWPNNSKVMTHCLQSRQSIATVILSDGSTFTGVYDSSNGHWLELTADGIGAEVGYCGDLRINGRNLRVLRVMQWTGGEQQQ